MDPNDQITPPAPTEAEIADNQEWDDVTNDLFPGLSADTTTTTTEVPVETTTTTTVVPEDITTTTTTVAADTTTTTTVDPNETPEQKAERERQEAVTDTTTEEPDFSSRDARQAAREAQAQVVAVAKDVREKMFKDTPTVLQDADGDPIDTIDAVMRHINPTTGEAFTQEEAGMWLLSAQQKFNQNLADIDKRSYQIAEVNVDLKDWADGVAYKYGELLKADESLRDRLWTEYEKTLVKDPETGIITDAPVNMETFYEVTLAPYAKLAETMENEKTSKQQADAEAAQKAEEDKLRQRQDRSDIFGRGHTDELTDQEDKEWAEAANFVFGPKKQ